MQSFKVPNKEVGSASVKNANWRVDAQEIAKFARLLPQFTGGLISEDQLDAWAAGAAKLTSPAAAIAVLSQSAGLGAKDMRTLIASSRGEYFPRDSAGELYERKLLERVALPLGPSIERERLATRLAIRHIIDTYGVSPQVDVMKAMASPNTANGETWLIGRPALVAEKDGQKHIFHVEVSDKSANHVDPNDNIAPVHYDLVATSRDVDISHLHLVKVQINNDYMDALSLAARTSTEAQSNLIAAASSMFSESGDKLRVVVHEVDRDPALYSEIVDAGRSHWKNLMQGERPRAIQDPPLQLESSTKEQYIEYSKQFVALSQMSKEARDQANVIGAKIGGLMRDNNVNENFDSPHQGTVVRVRDSKNLEQMAQFLEQEFGVDSAHLRRPTINVDRLQNAYMQLGGDVSDFIEHKTPDAKLIQTVAFDLGANLEEFTHRDYITLENPKTRGPIHDAIQEVKDAVRPYVKQIGDNLAEATIMDNEAFIDSAHQNKPQQSSMQV